ncbi:GINM1 protein, partial [Nothoprocta ornata]|nr:GINM1 protein [Nothoprocta ornata]
LSLSVQRPGLLVACSGFFLLKALFLLNFPSLSIAVFQETIRVNVLMLKTGGEFSKGQVVFNITYVNGQVYLNDFPMKSGVTHITCHTMICEYSSDAEKPLQGQRLGMVGARIMVHEWPLASSSDLKLVVIQEEVTEIDRKQVQQEEVTEINILVKDTRVLRHSSYTVPLKESMLYSMPRASDAVFTFPNPAGKDIQDPLQTTSQYLIPQAETTADEETLPGKLPETPLRMEPPSSYKVVMCQWVEDFRKGLCRFWFRSFPLFFNLMEVIVVGVVGATLILKVLKVIFPSCEHKGILLLPQDSFVPVIAISLPAEAPDRKDNAEEKACT